MTFGPIGPNFKPIYEIRIFLKNGNRHFSGYMDSQLSGKLQKKVVNRFREKCVTN